MKIGAIIPVFNEQNRIGGVLERFAAGLADEVVVVDDGSTDETPNVIGRYPVTALRHQTRRGIGAAIRTGLDHLASRGFDAAVVMAGNGKDDPAEIPRLVAPLRTGGADYVQGSRFLDGGSFNNLPWARFLMIKSFTLLWSAFVGRGLTDVTNGYRAYRLEILKDSRVRLDQAWLDQYELEYYLHYKVLTLGMKFTEIAVSKNYPSRTNYSKIRPLIDWWGIVKPLFLLRLGLRS